MDSLNENCIYEICKHLDLQDQINMACISRDFMNSLQPLWQRSHKVLDLREVQKKANFEVFVLSIKNTATNLILNHDKDSPKKILGEVIFPSVETIKMEFWLDNEEVFDDLVLLVVKSCPNLIELHLGGNFTGKHICQLEKLERISLYYSPGTFDFTHTEKIFKCLKLKKVALSKVVHWEYYDWEYLSIVSDDLLNNLLKCETLEELYFDSDFLEQRFLSQMVVDLKQLHKFAFSGMLEGFDRITGSICVAVKGVIINGYWSDYMPEAFLRMISRLNNLEMLSFSNISIKVDFLRRLIQTRINTDRRLAIYCHNTPVTNNDLRLLSNTSNVSFSLNDYHSDSFEKKNIELLLKL